MPSGPCLPVYCPHCGTWQWVAWSDVPRIPVGRLIVCDCCAREEQARLWMVRREDLCRALPFAVVDAVVHAQAVEVEVENVSE